MRKHENIGFIDRKDVSGMIDGVLEAQVHTKEMRTIFQNQYGRDQTDDCGDDDND